jgi:hypothetical protein
MILIFRNSSKESRGSATNLLRRLAMFLAMLVLVASSATNAAEEHGQTPDLS